MGRIRLPRITRKLLLTKAHHSSEATIVDAIIANQIDFHRQGVKISVPCKHFLRRLLQGDPDKRLSAEEALKHDFLITFKNGAEPRYRSMSHHHIASRFMKPLSLETLPSVQEVRANGEGSWSTKGSATQLGELTQEEVKGRGSLANFDDLSRTRSPSPVKKRTLAERQNEARPISLVKAPGLPSPPKILKNVATIACFHTFSAGSLTNVRDAQEDMKLATPRYMADLNVTIWTKNWLESELYDMLNYYHPFFEELKMIQYDRRPSMPN
jgi:serine/threonine protein kinase